MNPAPPSWSPNSLVREILGDRVWDPNAVSYAVAFAGMPADLAAAMKDRWFVLCAARRIRELLVQETTITHPRPLFNHGEGQPSTRYDWGTELRPAIYRELYGAAEPQEDEMITWRAVEEDWDTANGSVFWDGEGERKEFTGVHRVHSVAESTDGVYRLLDWGNGSEYLVALRKGLKAVPGTRNPASGYGVVRPDQQHIVDEATAELREQLADQAEALNAAHRRIEAARAALTG